MLVHKAKDTDKHEHFIKHLVYTLTVTLGRSYIFVFSDPDEEDEGDQTFFFLAVSTRWIAIAILLQS
ncbi:hypothetical protein GW17_00034093 [Ensete ventricosum]|nr:hypothetical protein GW17_00034093 [Ensete ventricosum]